MNLPRAISEHHGMVGTPEYYSWKAAKTRVYNKNRKDAKWYSDITMCQEWTNSFMEFYRDMGKRPEGTTLDRIDNTKGYEPGNCRWATWTEQQLNRRVRGKHKTGVSGVQKHGNGFTATFRFDYLGKFNTLEEATTARKKAEDNYKSETTGTCCKVK